MEKYGVEVDKRDNKVAGDGRRCPRCRTPLDPQSNVPRCPQCGTEPFEETK